MYHYNVDTLSPVQHHNNVAYGTSFKSLCSAVDLAKLSTSMLCDSHSIIQFKAFVELSIPIALSSKFDA